MGRKALERHRGKTLEEQACGDTPAWGAETVCGHLQALAQCGPYPALRPCLASQPP